MKLNKKYVFFVIAVGVAFTPILFIGHGRCVSEIVHERTVLKDNEREMCLAASSGNDLEYWLEGERSTDGCHWHLEHVKCQWSGCLYKCKEIETLWRLSKDGKVITMKKDVKGTNSNLPQEYHFLDIGQ